MRKTKNGKKKWLKMQHEKRIERLPASLCEKVVRIVDEQGSRGTTVVVHSFAGSLRGGNLHHSSAF